MAGKKTAVERKRKKNAKRKHKSWSKRELLTSFFSGLASNESGDRPWALTKTGFTEFL